MRHGRRKMRKARYAWTSTLRRHSGSNHTIDRGGSACARYIKGRSTMVCHQRIILTIEDLLSKFIDSDKVRRTGCAFHEG